jgi:glycosyltransferase involved in cell wall biosynthesis
MKIAIDARAYSWAGIGRYIRNLLAELAAIPHPHEIVVLLSRDDAAAYTGPFEKIVVDGSYYSWREQLLGWRELARVEADLWHFTHFNVPWLFNKPYVVTIHDVTRFIFPGQKRQRLLQQVAYEALFSHTVKTAKHIISVSAATAAALQELPIKHAAPQTIIHEGVDAQFFSPIPELQKTKIGMLLGTLAPYILYVGVWMSHKNLERVMQAYAKVRERHPDLRLVMTGRPVPGYANLIEVARELNIENRVLFPGFVPDELMPALYAQAQCFVFPSLYEGFGLPALEAAAVGTPVVTSNVTSLAELMSGAAELVNPESVDSIVGGIERVLTDAGRRQAMIAAGLARAADFGWRDAALRHITVYESAAA